jgi:hypothetical protein
MSRACVHEVVSSPADTPIVSMSKSVARLVKGPSPASGPWDMASAT